MTDKRTSSHQKEERYRELRDQGLSREKAASNSSTPKTGERTGYESRSREELIEQARKIGISDYSDMTRDELIEELRKR